MSAISTILPQTDRGMARHWHDTKRHIYVSVGPAIYKHLAHESGGAEHFGMQHPTNLSSPPRAHPRQHLIWTTSTKL